MKTRKNHKGIALRPTQSEIFLTRRESCREKLTGENQGEKQGFDTAVYVYD